MAVDPGQHAQRDRAESFGSVAEEYDRYRPSYPSELIDDLAARHPRDVLDVGCGTGKAAVLLAGRGLSVLGVEIDERMADVARGHELAVETGAFETWDDRGRSFDLITSAQAWHWVDPERGAAKVAQVLRPGGTIARFWNYHELDADAEAALDAVYRREAPQLGRLATTGRPKHVARSRNDPFGSSSAFSAVEQRDYVWEGSYTGEEWAAMAATHSSHMLLPRENREALLAGLIGTIDDLGGSLPVHHGTYVLLARRRDDAA